MMKRMLRLINRKKLNNKGMTLIEVMVAVIILSLVGGVLLQSFSTSAKVNRDAKEKQQAMVLAQSLMEAFKAYDTNSLEIQFSSVPNSDFKLYSLGASSTKSYSTDLSNNKYYSLFNIVFDGKAYDAKVKLTPTTSTAPFVKISDSNVYKDAIFRQLHEVNYLDGFQVAVVNELLALGAKPLDPGDFYQLEGVTTINKRVTTVDISANTVYTNVEYTFTVNNLEYTKVDPVDLSESTEYYSDTLTYTYSYASDGQSYNNSVTGAPLENVYWYYYPLYREPGHMRCVEDRLIIQNNSGAEKNFYIIKQKSGVLDESSLNSGEALYKLYTDVSGDVVNFYHNVDEEFTHGGHPDIVLSGVGVDKGSPWEQPASDPTVLLYNVEIDIYQAGSSDSIHRLTGTVNVQ